MQVNKASDVWVGPSSITVCCSRSSATAAMTSRASATIGATQLPQLAGHLEALAADDSSGERIAEGRHAVLRAYLQSRPSRLSSAETMPLDADYRAIGEFRQLASSLRQRYGVSVAGIGDALQSLDYERALLLRDRRAEEIR